MKNSRNYIPGLALTVAFLFAANTQADVITGVNWYSDKDTYTSTVAVADWSFGTFQQLGDDKSPRVWNFSMFNDGAQSTGTLTMSNFNGAGGLMQAPQSNDGTISFWHNSANDFNISFGDTNYVNSFYMDVAPHSSWSAAIRFAVTADYWLDGVKHTTNAVTVNGDNSFFGIALDEGAYLSAINFWSTGTPNNGYKVTAGFGGGYVSGGSDTTTPEPATLAVLGLGLAGLGIARRRMQK